MRHSLNSKVTFCQVFVPYKKNFAKPKVQRTQGIEFFDSLITFCSKHKLQQALKSWSNLSFVLFGKGREIQRTTLTNPHNKLEKSIHQF